MRAFLPNTSGLASRRNISRACGISFLAFHSETEDGVMSHSRAVSLVPPSFSITSVALMSMASRHKVGIGSMLGIPYTEVKGIPNSLTVRLADMGNLSERLRAAMVARPKITKRALAAACEISAPSVSDWFSGKKKTISSQHLHKAASVLGVRAEWLANGSGEMNAEGKARAAGDPPPAPLERGFDPASVEGPYSRIEAALIDLLIVGAAKDQVVASIRERSSEANATIQAYLQSSKTKPCQRRSASRFNARMDI